MKRRSELVLHASVFAIAAGQVFCRGFSGLLDFRQPNDYSGGVANPKDWVAEPATRAALGTQRQWRVNLFGAESDATSLCSFLTGAATVVVCVATALALSRRIGGRGSASLDWESGMPPPRKSEARIHKTGVVRAAASLFAKNDGTMFVCSARNLLQKGENDMNRKHGVRQGLSFSDHTELGSLHESGEEDREGGEPEPSFSVVSRGPPSLASVSIYSTNKSPGDLRFIEESLSRDCGFVFSALSLAERHRLINSMELVHFGANEVVCRKGDAGDYFYIVKEGTVRILIPVIMDKSVAPGKRVVDATATAGFEVKLPEHVEPSRRMRPTLYKGKSRRELLIVEKTRKSLLSATCIMKDDDLAGSGGGEEEEVERVFNVSSGQVFGELALLFNCPRTATCIAKTPCSFWRVDRRTFRDIMASAHGTALRQSRRNMALETLKKIPFLSVLDETALGKVADTLMPVAFEKDEVIIRKREDGDIFYIITAGEVLIHDIGFGDAQHADHKAGPGEYFGERALLTGEERAANVTATSDIVETLAMTRTQFIKKFGPLQHLIDFALKKRQLMSIPSFATSGFEAHEQDELVRALVVVNFHADQVIMKTGDEITPALYIIESGTVQIYDVEKNAVNTLTLGCHFGGETLTPKNAFWGYGVSDKCIKAVEDTVCSMLTISAIEGVIGDVSRLGKPLPPASSKLNKNIRLEDLRKHRILGVGSFGKVWLVQHKEKPSKVYALKVLKKRKILDMKAVDYVVFEKNMMASIDHPLIVQLVAAFQDNSSLYMLQGFVQGGELYSLIHTARKNGNGLSNDEAKFYGACIFESLHHLHRRNIIYRDLKPENVLIDRSGYCILIDFGFAKVVLDKSYTICGTPEYFAPELILGRGHNRGVDDWAFGVVLYELLVGRTPFHNENMSKECLAHRIITGGLAFSDKELNGISDVHPEARDIISKLLAKDPTERLGFLPSDDDEIRCHPWFDGILDSAKLVNKQIKAPWTPDINDPLDASHFESYTYEEIQERYYKAENLDTVEQDIFMDF